LRWSITMACRLRDWSIVRRFSRTLGGEREYLRGRVYGDRRWPDGTLITTTALAHRDGTSAVTVSGRRYVLEGAEPAAARCA
jgi:hypothetical protein